MNPRTQDSTPLRDNTAYLVEGRVRFLGYIRKRISDPDLAEDILQDSLLKTVRSNPGIRGEEELVFWFYRILQNAVKDSHRKAAAEKNRRLDLAPEEESFPSPEDEKRICECIHELVPTLKPEYAGVTKAIEEDCKRRFLGDPARYTGMSEHSGHQHGLNLHS